MIYRLQLMICLFSFLPFVVDGGLVCHILATTAHAETQDGAANQLAQNKSTTKTTRSKKPKRRVVKPSKPKPKTTSKSTGKTTPKASGKSTPKNMLENRGEQLYKFYAEFLKKYGFEEYIVPREEIWTPLSLILMGFLSLILGIYFWTQRRVQLPPDIDIDEDPLDGQIRDMLGEDEPVGSAVDALMKHARHVPRVSYQSGHDEEKVNGTISDDADDDSDQVPSSGHGVEFNVATVIPPPTPESAPLGEYQAISEQPVKIEQKAKGGVPSKGELASVRRTPPPPKSTDSSKSEQTLTDGVKAMPKPPEGKQKSEGSRFGALPTSLQPESVPPGKESSPVKKTRPVAAISSIGMESELPLSVPPKNEGNIEKMPSSHVSVLSSLHEPEPVLDLFGDLGDQPVTNHPQSLSGENVELDSDLVLQPVSLAPIAVGINEIRTSVHLYGEVVAYFEFWRNSGEDCYERLNENYQLTWSDWKEISQSWKTIFAENAEMAQKFQQLKKSIASKLEPGSA